MPSSSSVAPLSASGQSHLPRSSSPPPSNPVPVSAPRPRMPSVALDSFISPVNENGSFEFDRVIKSGYVQRRSHTTKTWRSIYLVLRPNALYLYKTDKEDKLRHKLFMSELTAVAFLRDPKQKRQHIFGLFSPSRNYHFEASSAKDAQDWVLAIRHEARIEEEEEEMFLASPAVRHSYTFSSLFHGGGNVSYAARNTAAAGAAAPDHERFASSSPEPHMLPPQARRLSSQQQKLQYRQQTQHHPVYHSDTAAYSGNEIGLSDYSDCDVQNSHVPATTLPDASSRISRHSGGAAAAGSHARSTSQTNESGGVLRPGTAGLPGGLPGAANTNSSAAALETDPERVVWQGWLWLLRGKGGVRQWKNSWAVLRQRNLILYKDESEYTAQLVVPLSSIVNVVERDPLSRTKKHCLQIITEEKNYRFAAHDEESLVQCLGAFKSLLAKRRGLGQRAAVVAAAATTGTFTRSPPSNTAMLPVPSLVTISS